MKTRLQLSAANRHVAQTATSTTKVVGASWDMIKQIAREEGVRGFYKGLSASYLGVTEGVIQWVLYERLKKLTQGAEGKGGALEWAGMLGSAGTAKCVASLITYPHEVCSTLILYLPVSFIPLICMGFRLYEHGYDNLVSTAS